MYKVYKLPLYVGGRLVCCGTLSTTVCNLLSLPSNFIWSPTCNLNGCVKSLKPRGSWSVKLCTAPSASFNEGLSAIQGLPSDV